MYHYITDSRETSQQQWQSKTREKVKIHISVLGKSQTPKKELTRPPNHGDSANPDSRLCHLRLQLLLLTFTSALATKLTIGDSAN